MLASNSVVSTPTSTKRFQTECKSHTFTLYFTQVSLAFSKFLDKNPAWLKIFRDILLLLAGNSIIKTISALSKLLAGGIFSAIAGAGAKKLYLCDFDIVNPSNLNRQFLFTENDKGSLKCNILRDRLSYYWKETEYIPTAIKVQSADDLIFAKDSHIIICCVDNAQGRKAVAEFSEKYKIPC